MNDILTQKNRSLNIFEIIHIVSASEYVRGGAMRLTLKFLFTGASKTGSTFNARDNDSWWHELNLTAFPRYFGHNICGSDSSLQKKRGS